jgi:hypothetical protein
VKTLLLFVLSVIGSSLILSCAKLASAATQSPSPTSFPKGHYATLETLPDWGGIWFPDPPAPPVEQPILKGKYAKAYRKWKIAFDAHHGEVPHAGSYCRPPGMPGIMSVPQYPIEFLFTPGRVTINFEAWMQRRIVFTDRSGHPAELDPTFNGDSVGEWRGNVLFVDTVAVKESLELGDLPPLGLGMHHSDKLHITEQLHLAAHDPDTLVDEMTLEDSLALAKPWHHVRNYRRSRDTQLLEFVCEENDRNPVDKSGHTGFD